MGQSARAGHHLRAAVLCHVSASAQDPRATLERASRALGADTLRTLQYSASGVNFAVGQSAVPGSAWPRFNIPSFSAGGQLRDRVAPRRAGAVAGRDAAARRRRSRGRRGAAGRSVVSGDLAWNVVGETRRAVAGGPGRAPAPALDHAPRGDQGRDGVQRHRAGAHDRLRGARPLHGQGHARRSPAWSRRSRRCSRARWWATCRSRCRTPTTASSAR